MSEFKCTHCGTLIELRGVAQSELASCPGCGGLLSDTADARDAVIDVPAVIVGTTDEVKAEPVFEDLRFQKGPWGPQGFEFKMAANEQRGVPCCGCGCLVLFVLAYLVLRGLGSLF